ncbi:MAG TPA: hypothetical protein VMM79_02135, partial [Longimicrobiales bacterium]|nr:hypothetical protein [Longimicrobiales bacterium]
MSIPQSPLLATAPAALSATLRRTNGAAQYFCRAGGAVVARSGARRQHFDMTHRMFTVTVLIVP